MIEYCEQCEEPTSYGFKEFDNPPKIKRVVHWLTLKKSGFNDAANLCDECYEVKE